MQLIKVCAWKSVWKARVWLWLSALLPNTDKVSQAHDTFFNAWTIKFLDPAVKQVRASQVADATTLQWLCFFPKFHIILLTFFTPHFRYHPFWSAVIHPLIIHRTHITAHYLTSTPPNTHTHRFPFSIGQSDTSIRILSLCSAGLASSSPHSASAVALCVRFAPFCKRCIWPENEPGVSASGDWKPACLRLWWEKGRD